MKDQQDIDSLHSQVKLLQLRAKTTDELVSIWQKNDKSIWSKDDFDCVQRILLERLNTLPEQKHESQISAFQEQLKKLESNGNDFRNSLAYINGKKEFGSSLFLLGSILLFALLLLPLTCTLSISVCVIVWGLIVFIDASGNKKKAERSIAEIESETSKIRDELELLKKKD
jgi:hypothetical protein